MGSLLSQLGGRSIHVPTSFGLLRGRLIDQGEHRILAIERHLSGHRSPPHQVNYRAMALGLKALGARHCLATAAVGALHPALTIGSFAVCTDFIDLTGRNLTLFETSAQHRDFSQPMGSAAQKALLAATGATCLSSQPSTTYVATSGPRYETPAEVSFARQIGGDVIGMTAASEAVVMREAGIDYACLAIVTNLAAGIGKSELSHGDVKQVMERSGAAAVKILLEAVNLLWV